MLNKFTLFNEIKNSRREPACLNLPEESLRRSKLFGSLLISRCTDGRWLFRLNNGLSTPCILCSSNYTDAVLYADEHQMDSIDMQFLLRTALECRFAHEGVVSIHAACVETDGFAIAFTGQSGRGKSTRARAWIEGLHASWISGDRPAIRIERDGCIACGAPWDGKEQILRDVERPLKFILEIRRSPANYVRRLTEDQAYRHIMQQCFVPMWDPNAAAMAMFYARRLVRQTPVYRAFCGPTSEDAGAIYDILVNHPEKIREEKKDMKIKKGFVLRNVVDEFMIMPTDENISSFDGAVVLNDVSAFIYRLLENPISRDDLLAAVLEEYDIDEKTASEDLDVLLHSLFDMGILEK